MTEVHKEAARYQADIVHQRTGKTVNYRVVVLEHPAAGRYVIQHSHVAVPVEGGNPWYSDSYTSADSLEEAETLVDSWANELAKSYEVMRW